MSPLIHYSEPDFQQSHLKNSPPARLAESPADTIAPEGYHATSNHPEYVKLKDGRWLLAPESRMDAVMVIRGDRVEVVEARNLKKGDPVVIGRTENGEEGIFVHDTGFARQDGSKDKFAFRSRGTRETPFSHSYDELYDVLKYDRKNGHIVWVLGPAVAFDKDSRDAMQWLVENGYCHGLMAGNALATHDLEAAVYKTGLGQNIYTQTLEPMGHYHHLDILNAVRRAGSIGQAIRELQISDGIMYACEQNGIDYVLAGSIRDDGPLPETIGNVYLSQDMMRQHARKATTVITMATQLHSIAFGNMTPGYKVLENGTVRPVYFYVVDISEFSADKLANRGSAQARAILTNVQDFIVNLWHHLKAHG